MSKNFDFKIFQGGNTSDRSGIVLYKVNGEDMYSGDSTNRNDEIDLGDYSKIRKLSISSDGNIYISGGVFATAESFPAFNESREYFYTGKSGILTNTIKVLATIDYGIGSEKLSLAEDADIIKALSYLIEIKLEEIEKLTQE